MSSSIPPEGPGSQVIDPGRAGVLSSDELLPPIEPPSAKFILQLFVVPAVIVAAVVLLWFVIESLARRSDGDVEDIVRTIGSSSQARFQKAHDLASMLNVPERYAKLRTDREAVKQLAAVLDNEIDSASDSESSTSMRYYLIWALGRFQVEEGLPVLLKAARTDPNHDMRQLAVQSIGMLANELNQLNPPQPIKSEEAIAGLLALADDQDEVFRAEAAYIVGLAAMAPGADERLAEKLVVLAEDPYTDARLNAAMALARLGDVRAVPGVAEMLEPDSLAASLAGLKAAEGEDERALAVRQGQKRNSIVGNALSSVDMLLAKKSLSPADRGTMEKALADFITAAPSVKEPAAVPEALLKRAQSTLAQLQSKAAGVESASP